MLKPDERSHLLELLRPPSGYHLDCAVGTTFSLDLLSALLLPLSFAFFDWEHADGQPAADPLALLEALRRYGDRFTVFCQAGQIRLPAKYPPLVTFLEPCVYEVQAPDENGVFHPKVWALRFTAADDSVRYRVLCLSRNLTFDRCWDTVVALDGELGSRLNAIAANHPLGDFIAALPTLTLPERRLSPKRKQGIAKMADELRRVRFAWPEEFDERQCRFWVSGLDGRISTPFGQRRDQSLIVSPFLSDAVVREFVDHGGATHLVSRPESLQEISNDTIRACATIQCLKPQLSDETNDEDQGEVLDGLHAKLFVVDRGWDASVFAGSFNATRHALEHNVEFMVELVGKKSSVGVAQFLKQVKGETNFGDLLEKYDPTIELAPTDQTTRQLDELFQAVKREIATAGPKLAVVRTDGNDLFDMTLSWRRALQWPNGNIDIRAWPITQQAGRGQTLSESLVFPRLSYEGLTPLFAFSITAQVNGVKGQSAFVMNLPMEGAPEDREERVLASLLTGKDQLLRYILFLLAAGSDSTASSGELAALLVKEERCDSSSHYLPSLLETMLRALHRDPTQLDRVASLLDALRKAPNGSALLSAEFQRIWEPMWKTAQEAKRK